MWTETYHRFQHRQAFDAACVSAGWSKGPDGEWSLPRGIVISIIGPLIGQPSVAEDGTPIPGDVIDARYHVNLALDDIEMPASFASARVLVATPRRTFGLPAPSVPPLPVPPVIDAWKAKYVLEERGLLSDAESAVMSAPTLVKHAWSGATTWSRDSEFLNPLAGVIGLNSAQVDDLFREADGIRT